MSFLGCDLHSEGIQIIMINEKILNKQYDKPPLSVNSMTDDKLLKYIQ